MTPTNNFTRSYFEHFDLIRFLAAFMIVLLHAYEAWNGWFGKIGILTSGTYQNFSPMGKIINSIIGNFGIGVDLFFLLSGFLITYILIIEKKQEGKIDIKNFMIRRTLRIWPLYYLLIIAAPFIVQWTNSSPTPDYLSNIFFLNNFSAIKNKEWIYPFAHFWSICIEEHFYLFWPFIIAFIPNKNLPNIFYAIIAGSILFRVYVSLNYSEPWFPLFLHTISRMDVLVLGSLAGFFYAEKPFEFQIGRFPKLILWILLLSMLSFDSYFNWETALMAGCKKFLYLFCISMLLLDFNFNKKFKHLLPSNSIFHYFGKISYGIYMYSNILIPIIIKKIMWPRGISNIWFFFGMNIFITLLISFLSYELFEKHLLKISKRFRKVKIGRVVQ